MTLLAPVEGRRVMLDAIVNKIPMDLRLFSNDHRPRAKDQFQSYSEPNGSGYSRIRIDSWETAKTGPPAATTEPVSFKFSTPVGKIYGYFVTTRALVPEVLFAERFTTGAFNGVNPGDMLKISINTSFPA